MWTPTPGAVPTYVVGHFAVDTNSAYFSSKNGHVGSVDLSDGSVTHSGPYAAASTGPSMAQEGLLVPGTDGKIRVFQATEISQLGGNPAPTPWVFDVAGGALQAGLSAAGSRLLAVDDSGVLHRLRLDGQLLTAVPTDTVTPTPSATPTVTETSTESPTFTHTPSALPTGTVSPTFSFSPTFSHSPTITETHTITETFTVSPTDTPTSTATSTWTATPTDTPTSTATDTATISPTFTISPTHTHSPTVSESFTGSPTYTDTPTATPTASPSDTPTATETFTWYPSFTPTPTITPGALGMLNAGAGQPVVYGMNTPFEFVLQLNSTALVSGWTVAMTASGFDVVGSPVLDPDVPSGSTLSDNGDSVQATFPANETSQSDPNYFRMVFNAVPLVTGPQSWGAYLNNNTDFPVTEFVAGGFDFTVVTATHTPTLTGTPTWTLTATPTWTPTQSPTFTHSPTLTSTYTASPTATETSSPSATPTATPGYDPCTLVHDEFNEFQYGYLDGNVALAGQVSRDLAAGTLGSFSSVKSLPSGNAAGLGSAWTWGGYLYVAGGYQSWYGSNLATQVSSIKLDGIANNSWNTSLDALPEGRFFHATVVLRDRVYLIGGSYWNGVDVTNDSTKVLTAKMTVDGGLGDWAETTGLPVASRFLLGTASKGYLWVMDGINAKLRRGSLDPDGLVTAWSSYDLPAAGSLIAYGDYLFLITTPGGGNDVYSARINDDGSLESWNNQEGDLPGDVWNYGAVGRGGKAYLAGGSDTGGLMNEVYSANLNADGTLGDWTLETNNLSTTVRDGRTVFGEGNIYHVGGYTGSGFSGVMSASLNEGSAKTDTVVYGHVFDLCNVQNFGGLSWNATNADYVRVQARVAGSNGAFGDWSQLSAPGAESVSLNDNGRYIEYRVILTEPASGDVDIDDITVETDPLPTYTNTPSGTPTSTSTWTPTATETWTPTATPTMTPTFSHSPTATPSATPTDTPTATPTFTASSTATPTATPGYEPCTLVHDEFNEFQYGYLDGNVALAGAVSRDLASGTLGSFSSVKSLPSGNAAGLGSAWTWGGYLYVAGGYQSWYGTNLATQVASIELDGIANNSWDTSLDALPEGRFFHATVVWRDRVYLMGGSYWNGSSVTNDSTKVLTAKMTVGGGLGDWTETTVLPVASRFLLGTASKGYLWVMDGINAKIRRGSLDPDGLVTAWSSYDLPAAGGLIAYGDYLFLITTPGGGNDVYSARINDDGSLGNWNNQQGDLPGDVWNYWGAGHGGKAYLAGGSDTGGLMNEVYSVELNADGTLGDWTTENTLTSNVRDGRTVFGEGNIYHVGGYTGSGFSGVLSASLNEGSAKTDTVVYGHVFDLCNVQNFGGLSWNATNADYVRVQARVAGSNGAFGDWSQLSAPGAESVSLNDNGRYIEYRVILTEPASGDVDIDDITVETDPLPTYTITPTITVTVTATPTQTDCGGGCGSSVRNGSQPVVYLPEGVYLLLSPNPAGESVQAFVRVDTSGPTRLLFYDIAGDLVKEKELGWPSRGQHRNEVDLRGLASGIYLVLSQTDKGEGYQTTGQFKLAVTK